MLAAILALALCSSGGADDFTFVQISDTHVEVRFAGDPVPKALRGEETFRWMAEELKKPQHIGALEFAAPEFVISTGDITEFGAPGETWKDVLKLYAWLPCEWWPVMGNHDNTWNPITVPYGELLATKTIARKSELSYSFDRHGCHFVVLNSATLNEPMPTIDVKDLNWLSSDLAWVEPRTPVFVFLHHPPDSGEFAQPYTSRMLFQVLDNWNIALIAYGHGHAVEHHQVFGMDCVQGGSTFAMKDADNRGYNMVTVKDGVLRVAYRYLNDAKPEQVLVEKPLVPKRTLGVVEMKSKEVPGFGHGLGEVGDADMMNVMVEERFFEDLGPDPSRLTLLLDGVAALSGAWSDVRERPGYKTLGVNPVQPHTRSWTWRGSFGEVAPGRHLVTVEERLPDGGQRQASWFMTQRSPVIEEVDIPSATATTEFGRRLLAGSIRYEGDANGRMTAFEGSDNAIKWTFETTGHAIESAPVIAGNLLVFGAWDGFVYALDKETGTCVWRELSPKAREMNGSRYYSAADCSPVVIGNRIFVCDRGYELAWYSLTGELHKLPFENIAAIGLSEDGQHLNLRGKDDVLTRIDRDGHVVWTTKVALGRFPCAPSEVQGMIVVCSDKGLVSWIGADDGQIQTQWQATSGAYVMSPVKAMVQKHWAAADPVDRDWSSADLRRRGLLTPTDRSSYVARVYATDGSARCWAYTP
jgi:hypothetical protein